MNYQIVCGNLGADAELSSVNGRDFVLFNVADSRRVKREDGSEQEETVWVSCIMNGKQESLLPYLKRGQKVLVMGRSSVRVYSSEKYRRMVAGINLSVDRVELVGASPDVVPKRLIRSDGLMVDTFKAYFVKPDCVAGMPEGSTITMQDERGKLYSVNHLGQVFPATGIHAQDSKQNNDAESEK